ncbi:MAG: 4-hydroxyphenylacetate 3-hydroxylase, partial [bacterium]|nr:4-hydroxyphenylacetate 3-hydroxylase [bacterium]
MRTGAQYLTALKDERCIYLHGEQVDDVTIHPAFCGISQTVASLYDLAADPENGMIFTAPETGRDSNKVYMIPRSQDDLKDRRQAITRWARSTNGLIGRGPDHVGGFLAGFASFPQFFGRFADNITRFYHQVLEENLFVTYVIIPPQIDRSKTAREQEEAFLQVGVYTEQDSGIVIRGAQMLGTNTAVSDHLFVSCIVPLKPGDEDYALSLVVPISTPGLKLHCRPPYASDKPSTFDYPLSTRFDEIDVLAVFDDVFVPWEQVFIYRDVEKLRAQFFETPAHVLGNTQAQIRLVVKLKFILGLARK